MGLLGINGWLYRWMDDWTDGRMDRRVDGFAQMNLIFYTYRGRNHALSLDWKLFKCKRHFSVKNKISSAVDSSRPCFPAWLGHGHKQRTPLCEGLLQAIYHTDKTHRHCNFDCKIFVRESTILM